MKVTFYHNALMTIETDRVKILTDPWFISGAFDGSWYHWPPLRTKPEDIKDYTHLYISHIHSDHCDLASMRRLIRKDVPVIILKNEDVFLRRSIQSCGFSNLIEIENGQSTQIANDVQITMYSAFSPSVFIENASVPNVVDSSLVVTDGKHAVFNANDNIPSPKDCEKIREIHGPIDIAMMPYGGVGPYPSSYANLTLVDKKKIAKLKCKKYLERLIENVRALQPKITVPCAGQMILGGRQSHKNAIIGMPEPQDAYDKLVGVNLPAALLYEGDAIDAEKLTVTRCLSNRNGQERNKLLAAYLKDISKDKYWWEEAFKIPSDKRVQPMLLLQNARNRMWTYQEKYNFKKPWHVAIRIEENPDTVYVFYLAEPGKVEKIQIKELFNGNMKFLMATMPYGYLIACLTRHCHWNNGYHGCHIEWYRRPDDYLPEIQILLSFFHL